MSCTVGAQPVRLTANVTGADTSPHVSANSTSGATPCGRTHIWITGGLPSVGPSVETSGRTSQPSDRCTSPANGWPGPIGATSSGGSGSISRTTGLADSSGAARCSGSPSVTTACTAARSPWMSSTSTTLIRRPRLRIEVTNRITPGSGAHRKLPETATGSTGPRPASSPSACAVRAALAHKASMAPPCTLGPMVQCLFNSPSKTRLTPSASISRSAIALVNNGVMNVCSFLRVPLGVSAQQVCAGELQ